MWLHPHLEERGGAGHQCQGIQGEDLEGLLEALLEGLEEGLEDVPGL